MASVSFEAITKRFGTTAAVDAISLDVAPGEFLALLGPSGCGKTTLLRLVAGFETPDTGEIRLDGRLVGSPVTSVPPEERGLGMVFQSYALWPHMSVGENVAFALRVRRLASAERTRRVAEALEMVGLAEMAERKPHQLSGGQRQRIALARCLAMRPAVVLLDEPLANLDAHLRESMQREFRRLHGEIGATFIYVTHDQAEAMSLADRIAVMDAGRLQQVGAPHALYREPRTEMVARFVGRGMVVPVETGPANGAGVPVRLFGHRFVARGRAEPGGQRLVCLRAESLALGAPGNGGIPGRVVEASYQGATTAVTVAVEDRADRDAVELRVAHPDHPPRIGERVSVEVRDAWLIPEAAPATARS